MVAVGGDLEPGTLVLAYRNGIFPWTTRPITWWSPDPRAVIPIGGLHVSRSLRKVIRSGRFSVTFDEAFTKVMEGCAASRPGREETWISRQFIAAYTRLNEMGYAHSVEVWQKDKLVGGLYGVSIGGLFAGESMYSETENASKVALVAMEEKLRRCGFAVFDVQMQTDHLRSMGAVEIPRAEYLARAAEAAALSVRFS
jgi:leucyl/phenylalanyl-tRNA--protein transferase